MARPLGSTQIRPTEAEIKRYTAQLKTLASEGDANAAGWLIMLNAFQAGNIPFKVINGQIVETRG